MTLIRPSDARTVTTVYDAQGQAIAVVNALGGRTTWTYDAAGRLTTTTPIAGRACRAPARPRGRRPRQAPTTWQALSLRCSWALPIESLREARALATASSLALL